MDSFTQFLLGASIAGVTLGSRLGPRALLVGGVVATLPDLDSLILRGDAIDLVTYHRSFSHSILVQTAAAPAITFALTRSVRKSREYWKTLGITVWLALVTHSLLDSLTTYGTQVFWPIPAGPPIAFPSVFIIDPIYSLLLLAGVLAIYLRRYKPDKGLRANRILLGLGTLYLALGMTGHMVAHARAAVDPAFANMRIHVQPEPFTILFWQVMGVGEDRYVVGHTTLLPACPISHISEGERMTVSPVPLEVPASVKRLEWFTNGFYTYHDKGDAIAITDLRLGFDSSLPFSFEIARRQSDDFAPVEPVQKPLGTRGVADLIAIYKKDLENLAMCGG